MKKKFFAIVAIMVLISTASAFSLALGAAFGSNKFGGADIGNNVMFSAKFDQSPVMWGVSYNFEDPFTLGVYGDYIMVREHLWEFFNIYAGPGVFFGYADRDDDSIDLGLRVPVALYIFPLDFLELFVEVAPAFRFIPGTDFGFQSALGFRFWFN